MLVIWSRDPTSFNYICHKQQVTNFINYRNINCQKIYIRLLDKKFTRVIHACICQLGSDHRRLDCEYIHWCIDWDLIYTWWYLLLLYDINYLVTVSIDHTIHNHILYMWKVPWYVNFAVTYGYSKDLIRENLLVCNN